MGMLTTTTHYAMSVSFCKKCQSPRNILASRQVAGYVRRRCICTACGQRWSTVEITAEELKNFQDENSLTKSAVQTARLIRLLDFFRERLVASLPDPN
jgi:transcriptional regulator NrdR family protein